MSGTEPHDQQWLITVLTGTLEIGNQADLTVGDYLTYLADDETIEQVVVDLLERRGWTLATAPAILEQVDGAFYQLGGGLPYNPADSRFADPAYALIDTEGTAYLYDTTQAGSAKRLRPTSLRCWLILETGQVCRKP